MGAFETSSRYRIPWYVEYFFEVRVGSSPGEVVLFLRYFTQGTKLMFSLPLHQIRLSISVPDEADKFEIAIM